MNKQRYLLERLLDVYGGNIEAINRDAHALRAERERSNADHAAAIPDVSDQPVVVRVDDVSKRYKLGKTKVEALAGVSLEIRQGEMVALIGASGSGKSTLLQLIGGLDSPSGGAVTVDGINLGKMSDAKLSRYRGQKIGFVFQSFYLQPFLNVRDNIEVPAMFARVKRATRHEISRELTEAVGLNDRLRHYSKELSGGQIQRTAIARALVNRPKILLADEPTGNLDRENAEAIFDLFAQVRRDYGTTVIVVTHDENLAVRMDRTIRLSDGKVVS